MTINDTILLSVSGTVAGQRHVHTLHFRAAAAGDIEAAILTDWQTSCMAAYKALFVNTDSPCVSLVARQVCGTVPLRAPQEANPATVVGTYDSNGASMGDAMAPWLASYVSVKTASAGKSRAGRFYLGGLNEAWVTGDVLIDNAQGSSRHQRTAAYLTALARYVGSGTYVSNALLVVHSHKLASVPGTQCQNSSTPVTAFINRTGLATMKSRKAGHGT